MGLAATAAWLIVRSAEHPNFADLAVAAVGVRTFAIGKGVLRYGERLASHDATLRLLADLRATAVGRLARLSPTGLPSGGRGDVLTRLVDDIDRLQDLFLRVLGPLVSTLVVALGTAAAAALIDPAAGLALGAAVVVVGMILPAAAHRATHGRGTVVATRRGEAAAATIDLAEHVDEVAAIQAERHLARPDRGGCHRGRRARPAAGPGLGCRRRRRRGRSGAGVRGGRRGRGGGGARAVRPVPRRARPDPAGRGGAARPAQRGR